jgi:hypothetical protein
MLRNIVPTVLLARELSIKNPGVKAFLAVGGDPSGVRQSNQALAAAIAPLRSVQKIAYFLNGAPVQGEPTFSDIEREFASGKQAFLVATQIANAGLSLPTADYLVMAQRLFSPGEEEQAEDRINRAGKMMRAGATNEIIYPMPDDIFSAVIGHRLENRRRSLLALYNEEPGDDYANSLSPAFRARARRGNQLEQDFFAVVEAASDPNSFIRRAISDRLT